MVFGALALAHLARWDDADGAAATRFRLVADLGVSFPELANTALAAGGYPLDAVLALPLVWLSGSWAPVAGAAWLAVAGGAAAWLVGAWWGSALAGTLAGLAWMLTLDATFVSGDTATLAALALLPLAWGMTLRALGGGAWQLFSAAGLTGAIFMVSAAESRALLVLFAVTAGAAARSEESRRHIGVLVGVLAGGLALALPALALRATAVSAPFPEGARLLPLLLVAVAGVSAWSARAHSQRLLLPICALVGGLGPVEGSAAAGLGLVCLAGAGVIPAAQLASRLAAWRGSGKAAARALSGA